MAEMLLTIQHDGTVFSPPVEDGVKIEWERTGSPGKLTFTTITPRSGEMNFTEGDPVCFYYDEKPIFMGYVFTKKHDKEKQIQVTCYDQIRYLKNKFSYVFENKTATQIVQALCADFNLQTGEMDNTNYVIPAIAEENKSALDIVLSVLEDTLLNTGNMFVLYDDFGKLRLSNAANMTSLSLIYGETAENFDFSSSIDKETYNQVVLYYKQDNKITQIYTASSPSSIKQWGTLRYFEEVKTPTIGQNKANSLLNLYNRKTRELKITDAFGDISVRGGTLIPVQLDLGETITNNFMLVEKVTHKFSNNHHTMDLTLEGAWGDKTTDMVSETLGELIVEKPSSSGSGGSKKKNTTTQEAEVAGNYNTIKIEQYGVASNSSQTGGDKRGSIVVHYFKDKEKKILRLDKNKDVTTIQCDPNSLCEIGVFKGVTIDSGVLKDVRRYYDVSISSITPWTKTNSNASSIPTADYHYNRYMSANGHFMVYWKTTYSKKTTSVFDPLR